LVGMQSAGVSHHEFLYKLTALEVAHGLTPLMVMRAKTAHGSGR
jgi:hypothetical protein